MKKRIIRDLLKIKKVAELTNMSGKISVAYEFNSDKQFEDVLNSITEFEINYNIVQITPTLAASIIWK